ncbi:MAG: hypothetical protein NUV98_01585 [Candidatus Roizmanbacteria bacterium]|nr:hypothetical protein [Candidatus Roizmanbacteria bacterium]
MHERINERVKILSIYDPQTGTTTPYRMKWRNHVHDITQVTYYHSERLGRTVLHIFHLTDGNLDFKVVLNSETLSWILKEVSDGSVN